MRTYCYKQQRRWEEYLSPAEDFINLACHQSTNETPYTAMFEKRPPREITEMIDFPQGNEYKFNKLKFYNNAVERAEKLRIKYKKSQPKIITYEVGDKVLLKNRELPSAIEGIAKKLLLLYTCLLYTSRCV